jgi:acyl-CoA synthetase (AMP-forming)/AMP-acid ligase II
MTIIYNSPLPDVEIPDISITTQFLQRADELADDIAISDAQSSSFTFAELKSAIHRLAGGLQAHGLRPGDVVGIMSPNVPEYAVIFHGVAVAGAAVTTINPTYGAEEVRFQLLDAGATMLFTTSAFLDVARAAAEGTGVKEIAVIGQAPNARSLDSLYGDPIEQVVVDFDQHVVVLPYSSGTTGLPKGVMLTHRNLVANNAQLKQVLNYDDNEAALAVLPFFHIYGMQVLMNSLISQGVRVVTMPRFDMVAVLEVLQSEKITRFFAVPPIVLGLAKAPIVDQYDLSSLRQIFCGAAPLGAEIADACAARVGCEVIQGYGMTELSPVSHCTPPGDYHAGTSGVTVSNTEIRIVDSETGQDQNVGSPGELWIRGPQVMKGYLNNASATAETIDADRWLHTGDVAVVDEFNHVSIVDRIKELIKYKGFQVPPAELEALLVTHPQIADAAVIGVADDEAGELPKAFLVAAGETLPTLIELQEFLSAHVARYKLVREIEFISAIPKSPSGKILRRDLRAASA